MPDLAPAKKTIDKKDDKKGDKTRDTGKDKPLKLIKPINLYIHNIEVLGSAKIDDFLCKTLAKMFCDKKMTGQGQRQDPSDIHVRVTERKVNVSVHNTWQQVSGETRSSTL